MTTAALHPHTQAHTESDQGNRSWVPIAIALLGVGVLIYWTSTARPLWVDEEMLGLNARYRSFSQFAGALWLDQSAPLGWLLLERLVLLTLGAGERAARLLTLFFGAATLATATWIGRRWMTSIGAAVLVSLCAFGEWIVFFTLELKHYSADAFFALWLPALAAWVSEDVSRRRIVVWWLVATIGMWLSNGAIFVTPACAIVLIAVAWQRRGWRQASLVALNGLAWTISFALCYELELRHATANAYLRNYWAFAFPPTSRGVVATMSWWLDQLGPFAVKPAGCQLPVLFWVVWAFGIVFAIRTRRALSLMFASVPASAAVLATLHIVPTFERLAVWAVPALYVGIALCADTGATLLPRYVSRGRALMLTGPAALILATFVVCADVVRFGERALEYRSPRSNYGLDDKSSIRWLLNSHRPGDAVVTTHFGLAGLWWYSGANISDIDRSMYLADGSPVFEIHHIPAENGCERWRDDMTAALGGHSRVAVYLGFRMNVEPVGFDDLVIEELSRRGTLVGFKPFADVSRVAVFELKRAPDHRGGPQEVPHESVARTTIPGCVSITPARRW
jgi:hypothetical protein